MDKIENMFDLQKVESVFFTNGPQALKHAALLLVLIGGVGGMVLAFSAEGGFSAKYLWFVALGVVPASLCWLLSITVHRRHIATVPLVAILSALSLYLFGGNPNTAMDGISPQQPLLTLGWIVVIAEYIAVALLLAFVFWLWKKGSLSKA